MDCKTIQRQLHAWIDGETTPAEHTAIGAHVERCPICREKADQIRSTKAVVKRHTTTPDPDPSFEGDVRRAILEQALYEQEEREQEEREQEEREERERELEQRTEVHGVVDGTATEGASSRGRPARPFTRRAWVAAGAVAVITGIVGIALPPARTADARVRVVDECLDLHARMLSDMDEPEIACNDAERAGRAAKDRLRLSGSPAGMLARFDLAGYTPISIEFGGRPVVGIEYFCRRGDDFFTIVIFAMVPEDMELEALHFDDRRGFTVATWADAECVMAVATAAPRAEVERLLAR